MTFNFAPWAINGARSTAGLARLAAYAANGRSGIVQPADLRVTALSVPGNGLQIGSGGAVILNGYLSDPDEAYVVSNPGSHIVLSNSMPAPQPSTRYYLVCVVIGDPEFNQTGHPFMPAGLLDPAVAPDFEYVRTVILPCSATTTRFDQLGLQYPGLALARLEVPPNTTTITNSMITNLRVLAQAPRTERKIVASTLAANNNLTSPDFTMFPLYQPTVVVPIWATHVTAIMRLSGIVTLGGSAVGALRPVIGNLYGAELGYDVDTADGERREFSMAIGGSVASMAGQTAGLWIEGRNNAGSGAGYLTTLDGNMAQAVFDLQFYEAAV